MNGRIRGFRRARGGRGRTDQRRGQALVEFVMCSMVLMLFLLGIFEFSRHYYARLTARHQVGEAARIAATGQTLIDPETGEPMTRGESVLYYVQTAAASLPLVLEWVVMDPPDGGDPGDIVQIRARYRFAFVSSPLVRAFAPSSLSFTVAAVVKNEPRF